VGIEKNCQTGKIKKRLEREYEKAEEEKGSHFSEWAALLHIAQDDLQSCPKGN
jgi:hypothetical protein